jgi:glutamate synthase domain-containing protein 2
LLHAKAYEYAGILKNKGVPVVDMAFAGGLAKEEQIFKALALGAPFTKLVCMGRSLMIPGFLGANIEGVFSPKIKAKLNGNWDKLPNTVSQFGKTPDELFAGYYDVQKKVGKSEMKNIPFGAIAAWTLADKLGAGLQQLMAGARKFSLSQINRDDIYAANRETAEITGITYIAAKNDDIAKAILKS